MELEALLQGMESLPGNLHHELKKQVCVNASHLCAAIHEGIFGTDKTGRDNCILSDNGLLLNKVCFPCLIPITKGDLGGGKGSLFSLEAYEARFEVLGILRT